MWKIPGNTHALQNKQPNDDDVDYNEDDTQNGNVVQRANESYVQPHGGKNQHKDTEVPMPPSGSI